MLALGQAKRTVGSKQVHTGNIPAWRKPSSFAVYTGAVVYPDEEATFYGDGRTDEEMRLVKERKEYPEEDEDAEADAEVAEERADAACLELEDAESELYDAVERQVYIADSSQHFADSSPHIADSSQNIAPSLHIADSSQSKPSNGKKSHGKGAKGKSGKRKPLEPTPPAAAPELTDYAERAKYREDRVQAPPPPKPMRYGTDWYHDRGWDEWGQCWQHERRHCPLSSSSGGGGGGGDPGGGGHGEPRQEERGAKKAKREGWMVKCSILTNLVLAGDFKAAEHLSRSYRGHGGLDAFVAEQ